MSVDPSAGCSPSPTLLNLLAQELSAPCDLGTANVPNAALLASEDELKNGNYAAAADLAKIACMGGVPGPVLSHARAQALLGSCQVKMGNLVEAVAPFENATRILRALEQFNDLTRITFELASVHANLHHWDAARDVIADLQTFFAERLTAAPESRGCAADVVRAAVGAGQFHQMHGNSAESEYYFNIAYAACRAEKLFPVLRGLALSGIAEARFDNGDFEAAELRAAAAWNLLKPVAATFPWDFVESIRIRGCALQAQKKYEAAGECLDDALQQARQLFSDNHRNLLPVLHSRIVLHLEQEEAAQAEPLLSEGVSLLAEYPDFDVMYAAFMHDAAELSRQHGDEARLERILQDAVAHFWQRGDCAIDFYSVAVDTLVNVLEAGKKLRKAEDLIGEKLSKLDLCYGTQISAASIATWVSLSRIMAKDSRFVDSAAAAEMALELCDQLPKTERSALRIATLESLSNDASEAGDPLLALRYKEQQIATYIADGHESSVECLGARNDRIELLTAIIDVAPLSKEAEYFNDLKDSELKRAFAMVLDSGLTGTYEHGRTLQLAGITAYRRSQFASAEDFLCRGEVMLREHLPRSAEAVANTINFRAAALLDTARDSHSFSFAIEMVEQSAHLLATHDRIKSSTGLSTCELLAYLCSQNCDHDKAAQYEQYACELAKLLGIQRENKI